MNDQSDWKGEALIRISREKSKIEIARLNRTVANRRRHAEKKRARDAEKKESRDE